MTTFTSKELYLMNGGQKLYIYKDGFGDIYNATAAEEAEWAKEVVAKALTKIETEENSVTLQFAIADLLYHHYDGVEALLMKFLPGAGSSRQIVFATALWKTAKYKAGFDIVLNVLQQHRAACLNEVFYGLVDFKDHEIAKHFLIGCLQGDDVELAIKAHQVFSRWAWTGIPELREQHLLDFVQPENKSNPTFQPAIERLKEILKIQTDH